MNDHHHHHVRNTISVLSDEAHKICLPDYILCTAAAQ